MIAIKIINLNTKIKVFAIRIIADLVFKINSNNIYLKMALILKQNTMVLFKIIMMRFEIWCFNIIISIYLVYYLIIVIFKNKYFLILYYKFF